MGKVSDRQSRMDLGLTVIEQVRKEGDTMTQGDVAAVCGVSRGAIYFIEKRAIAKLRAAAEARGLLEELRELISS